MDVEDIEMKSITQALFLRYGYDFRSYTEASFKRRLRGLMPKANATSLSQLQHVLLHDEAFFYQTFPKLMLGTSEMFRDPLFFKALRKEVFPILGTYPSFKVWHAGCSTGEEVYSLAILLKEEGLYDRATIYATDINEAALKTARSGIFPLEALKIATANYHIASAKRQFSDYYTALYGSARLAGELSQNIVFSEHNLVTDEVFSEMHLILCRNVLIYFKRDLQNRVLDLFTRSLAYRGFLGLGSKETVRFLEGANAYERFVPAEKIFRRAPNWSIPRKSDDH